MQKYDNILLKPGGA